jgi:hypothetical protein
MAPASRREESFVDGDVEVEPLPFGTSVVLDAVVVDEGDAGGVVMPLTTETVSIRPAP